jgi:hypothetical protein
MVPSSKTFRTLKRLISDTRGNFSVIFGLAALPMIFAAGTAVDYARYSAAMNHLQLALDAGALAAASEKGWTDAQRISLAEKAFDVNIEKGAAAPYKVDASFKVVDGVIISQASVEVPTSLMSLAGIDSLAGDTRAEVGILQDVKAEIALVLDYSGSMGETLDGNVKYKVMKDAAKKLVNDLAKSDPDKVKFALVPFSHHVYTTLPGELVVGGTAGKSWTGCTQDRLYPHNLTNTTPTKTDDDTKWNQPQAPEHVAWGCDGYTVNKLRITDLTDNFKSITSSLDAMRPYAWTHIALGVEFGYNVLSPNKPYDEAVSFNDKNSKKFMVVLTDGMQTEPGFGPSGQRDVAAAESNLEQLCKNAKQDKITIITMAFDLDDTGTRQRLQACASDPKKDFFVAKGAADLTKAFESVKAAITAEIFLAK